MHLAIDCREALHCRKTGKGVWTLGLIRELQTRDLTLTYVTDVPVPDTWKSNRHRECLIPEREFRWHLKAADSLKKIPDLDAYISTVSYIIPALFGKKIPCQTVVHDLIAWRGEPHDRKATLIEKLTLGLAVWKSRCLFAISEATKGDLLHRFPSVDPNKVSVIYAGPLRERVSMRKPEGNFILCAATLCPRKNQKRLIQAHASLPEHLRSQYELILVGGRGWEDQEIIDLVQKSENVIWKNYVDDREYEELLSTCRIFALPSLYEGFGMPVLDAMQRGIPVLTSDRGSLKEVAGNAAVMVDPEDTKSISGGLQGLLTNAALRADLSRKGPLQASQFSWKRTVDLLLQSL